MRIRRKNFARIGQLRVVRKFLWWPKRLNGPGDTWEETRWLSTETWEEVYMSGRFQDFWAQRRWVD